MKIFINSIKMILFVSIIAGIMSLVRFVLTGYDSYLWLNWNLFLALVPILFAWFAVISKKYWLKVVFIFAWLGFLPNAPYIITDFIHLADVGPKSMLWYDASMIFMFTIAGISSWIVSLHMLRKKFSWPIWSIGFISFLTGFGVYIGRYLRLNTWDIITNPLEVFETIGLIIIYPQNYKPVAMMTIVFTIILSTLYIGWTSILKNEQTSN